MMTSVVVIDNPAIKKMVQDADNLGALDEVEYVTQAVIDDMAYNGIDSTAFMDHHDVASKWGSNIARTLASEISLDIVDITDVSLKQGDIRVSVQYKDD